MNLQENIFRVKQMMGIIRESDERLSFVFDPNTDKVIGFNITSEDELNGFIYDDDGNNRGYGWGLQLNDSDEIIRFDSLEDAQLWYRKKKGNKITKETQNSKYPKLSSISYNIRNIEGLDYDVINRGSCFKFAKEISKLGYDKFTFIFSNDDQEVIHVYIKLNNNLYFDAIGFHTKKEIKQEYLDGEDNDMYDSDISELNHYCNLDTYSGLTTIPISNQVWSKVIELIHTT